VKSGWEFKNISEMSAINYGYTESAVCEPVGPRFLRITDIQDDRVDWENVPFCKIELAEIPKYRLASGDIVFARTGATTGKSFLVNDPPEAVFASYLIRLRLLDKKLLPEFVSLFFQTDGYWKSIKDGSAGSAQGGFNATKLGALSIPLPPLPEQHSIVGILEKAFESIAIAKANAEKNLQNARALFESYLQSVFLKGGAGWKNKPLGEIAEVQSGGTPSVPKKDYWGGDIPWYSSGELNHIFTTNPERKITKAGLNNSNAKLFPKGSLLVGMYDTAALKMSILDRDATFNQAIAGVKPNDKIEVEFVLYAINANKPRLLLERRGVRQKNLSLRKIKEIGIPLPELSKQRAAVTRLRSVMAETQRLESIYQHKVYALESLKKSLLHQAFSGEL
jgi:type I restriction enzyme, S subunit